MQPPDTEPTASPSPRSASIAPGGRGLEPKVSTTVTSHSGRSAACHSRSVFSTERSTLSICTSLVPADIFPGFRERSHRRKSRIRIVRYGRYPTPSGGKIYHAENRVSLAIDTSIIHDTLAIIHDTLAVIANEVKQSSKTKDALSSLRTQ